MRDFIYGADFEPARATGATPPGAPAGGSGLGANVPVAVEAAQAANQA